MRVAEYPKDLLLRMYETMVKIRKFEEKAEALFLEGKLPGFIHLYIGEEAIATGVMMNLRPDDYITSTHRGHGHLIAKGADVRKMMAELYGKRTGYNKGKGGSMHIMDFSIGILGANGVVGGGLPIASGAGMAIKLKGTDQVVVAFFGDGASNRGTFHEALNWCAIYKLPVVFVCENNMYASTAYVKDMVPIEDIADRAAGYGIPGVAVDGNDVIAVYEVAKEAVERARRGQGPTLIEAKTYRLKGHFVGDPELYRDKEEVERFWKNEPIGRFERRLMEIGALSEGEKRQIHERVEKEIEEAVRFSEESPDPAPEEALTDLFVDDTGYDYY